MRAFLLPAFFFVFSRNTSPFYPYICILVSHPDFMYKKKVILFFLCVSVIVISLMRLHPAPKVIRAFYYWKTTREPNHLKPLTEKIGVSRLYLRYFDVDWSEGIQGPVPRGKINLWDFETTDFKEVCPVIFITPRTFERIQDDKLNALADKILKITQEYSKSIGNNVAHKRIPYPESDYGSSYSYEAYTKRISQYSDSFYVRIPEIQIDCDWNEKTKEKYFTFLQLLKKKIPEKTLSVTLRLYPYKFSETMGIPPADKAMLMCYNTGSIKEKTTRNAILDTNEVKSYLSGVKNYPLPLDVALPLFRWGVWFRYGQYKGIVHEFSEEEWRRDTAFASFENNHFRIKTDKVIGQNYYREGDEIRFEKPYPADILATAKMVRQSIGLKDRVISFYHWESNYIQEYENCIQETYKIFE